MIKIYQGNSTGLKVKIFNKEDGSAADLTGYTVKLYVKKSKIDTVYVLDKGGTVSEGENTAVFSLAIEDTNQPLGQYTGEVVLEASDKVITVLQFDITIVESVKNNPL